jgi:hypothetical protein
MSEKISLLKAISHKAILLGLNLFKNSATAVCVIFLDSKGCPLMERRKNPSYR